MSSKRDQVDEVRPKLSHKVATVCAVIGAAANAVYVCFDVYMTMPSVVGSQILGFLADMARLDTIVHLVLQAALGLMVGFSFGILLEIGLGIYFPGDTAQDTTDKTPTSKPMNTRHRMH